MLFASGGSLNIDTKRDTASHLFRFLTTSMDLPCSSLARAVVEMSGSLSKARARMGSSSWSHLAFALFVLARRLMLLIAWWAEATCTPESYRTCRIPCRSTEGSHRSRRGCPWRNGSRLGVSATGSLFCCIWLSVFWVLGVLCHLCYWSQVYTCWFDVMFSVFPKIA